MVTDLYFAVALAVFAWLALSRFGRSEAWAAAIAPLASIIGSGFLVSALLLARLMGSCAPIGMALLLLAAAGFAGSVRHNIAHVEARAGLPALVGGLDRLSELALAFAYLVSVGYYLALLGDFVTRLAFGAPDRSLGTWIATELIVLISALGWSGGLCRVIKLEARVVALKLAVIAGFLAALAWHDFGAAGQGGAAALAPLPGHFDLGVVPVLLGLLIVVQGFEASRYLGEEFDAPTRIPHHAPGVCRRRGDLPRVLCADAAADAAHPRRRRRDRDHRRRRGGGRGIAADADGGRGGQPVLGRGRRRAGRGRADHRARQPPHEAGACLPDPRARHHRHRLGDRHLRRHRPRLDGLCALLHAAMPRDGGRGAGAAEGDGAPSGSSRSPALRVRSWCWACRPSRKRAQGG